MHVILFGLTGFGNSALRGIQATGAEVMAVVTRREPKPTFPYYPECNLSDEAKKGGIPVYEDMALDDSASLNLLKKLRPDLLLVSTFHRKIPTKIIQLARQAAINVHPSLLPAYPGATPTTWCLVSGEAETGITAHYLTAEIDAGPIIAQRRVAIDDDDTDGTLRFKLARASEPLVGELIRRLMKGEKIQGVPQDKKGRKNYPKRTKKDAFIEFNETSLNVYNRIRANLPYPGPYTACNGKEIPIKEAKILTTECSNQPSGSVIRYESDTLDVTTRDGTIKIKIDSSAQVDLSGDGVILGQ